MQREITHKQYLNNISADRLYYTQKAELEKEFGKSDSESRMKALEHAVKQTQALDKSFEDSKTKFEKFLKELDKELKKFDASKALKTETDKLEKEIDAFFKAEENRIKELNDLRQQLDDEILEKKRDKELEALHKLHEAGLISEKEYATRQLKIWMAYAADKLQVFQQFTQMAGNLQAAWSDAQYAQLEAAKEKELTLAGDNEEARQQIEDEYAQKKLDLDKAQADTKFRIQVAQIIASTALAIMQGYAQLGPIAGSIAAAMLAATGAMQIKAANAEREKVKAMSLKTTGGSSTNTQRVLLPGLEQGGYMVEREQDGKQFNARFNPDARGYINKPTVLVGESGNEFVASNAAVQNPTVKPVLDIINIAQKQGTVATLNLAAVMSTVKIQGRESGGCFSQSDIALPLSKTTTNTSPTATTDNQLNNTLEELCELLYHLKTYGVKAPIVFSEWEKMQVLKQKSDKLGNLR